MRVVLFDGVCALCDWSVRWLLGVDTRQSLHYAPLQGQTAAAVLSRHPDADQDVTSVVYVRDLGEAGETLYHRSDAALAILRDLGGGWRIAAWLRFVPRPMRDGVYNLVAKYRYRWFGKYDTCQLPSESVSSRFLP
jgi:predicted DCC family thiol-disulfide oxidoreductase YuxK